MITFDQGIEYIYAKEEKNTDDKSLTSKTDEYAEGSKKSGENEYIIIDTENGEQALLITEKAPKVRGVVVVCEGGGNPSVAATVQKGGDGCAGHKQSQRCVSVQRRKNNNIFEAYMQLYVALGRKTIALASEDLPPFAKLHPKNKTPLT